VTLRCSSSGGIENLDLRILNSRLDRVSLTTVIGSLFHPLRDQGIRKSHGQQVTRDLIRQERQVELGGAVLEPHGFNSIPSPLDLECLAEETLEPVGAALDPKARAHHVSHRESL
jgi:hypothetical protein